MRIAVATRSGQEVDVHFGQADSFTIYDVDEQEIRRKSVITVEKYCSSDPNHTFHETRFAAIAKVLDGCRVVVSQQIGDVPRAALTRSGILHVNGQGSLEQALRKAYLLISGGGVDGPLGPAGA
ncbi:MAG: NifB/NifX family molybdenum-iron cluster-binding protein [Syntrophotaleaceae bacterium]